LRSISAFWPNIFKIISQARIDGKFIEENRDKCRVLVESQKNKDLMEI
jgi:hypothetical protein